MAQQRRQRDVIADLDGVRERDARAEIVWFVALSVLWLSVLVAGVVGAASLSPTFCSLCHSDPAGALKESPHASVKCDSCHVRTGVLGLAENRLQVVGMVAAAPSNLLWEQPQVADTDTDSARCLACHVGLLGRTKISAGIRMNHAAPEREGWACSTCHRGTAHPDEMHDGSSYSMDMCMRCHSANPDNQETCTFCHVDDTPDSAAQAALKTPWEVTHGSNWQSTHGMGDLESCDSCHSSSYCVGCHGVPVPHPAKFMMTHGDEVLEASDNIDWCFTCHQQTECDACHGMPMPHPDGFVRKHEQEIESLGSATCERCHAESSCQGCHERHTHPGIPTDQLELLERNPVNDPVSSR